ncbi:uncharacterized protein TrAFT101_001786 [Trichoderma asperellum]|uniref:uncharacterized protein n=1 Tax=Trichoderma asperellum TaxID=101201 RepID=UPI00332C38E3|nr:hypothetical protein TrAFT101_001786 [Trichoderma asperellum]
MKDSESGAAPQPKMSTFQIAKKHLLEMKFLMGTAVGVCMLAAILVISLLAAHCAGLEKLLESQRRFAIANEEALPMAVHKLGRRDADFHETNMAISDSSAEVVALVLDNGSISAETQSLVPKDVVSITSIPISTQTATSTIYSIITPTQPVIVTRTTTMTTSVLPPPETSVCSAFSTTVTVTVTVVPTPSPWASSSVLGDVTVTAGASTITNFNTDVSYTSGLPDATISGSPSTVTDIDVSITGLPDVTISGNPSTVTNVLTDVSLTSGLPDATVSGNPSTVTAVQTSFSHTPEPVTSFVTVVISDLWGASASSSIPELVTVTAISTVRTTVTTIDAAPSPIIVTVTSAYPEPTMSTSTVSSDSSKAGAQTFRPSVLTETITASNGELATTTTTILIPTAFSSINGTASVYPSGTATSVVMPTIPIVVSGSSRGMEPLSHALCLITAITAMMSML